MKETKKPTDLNIKISNRNLMVLAAITVLGILAVMSYFQNAGQKIQQYTQRLTQTVPTSVPREMVVVLGQQNKSKESGTATLRELNGQLVVTLNLTGAPKGISQPAHIHIGNCPGVGEVKYPLSSPVNGWSETTLNVTFDQLMSELPLAINVHKSAKESKVYVSCGQLSSY
ncbi:hypothetical protein HY008_02150 [Candidatus Woesebacteria bacterium]|nr:hypothetical protein [Candidatus Woesebacteria bacterium]